MTYTPISETLRDFFESEERNTRQAIAQGDLEPGFPLTLGTALESLRQAPEDVQLLWLAGTRQGNIEDWSNAVQTMIELANLIDRYGGDTSLMEWLR